MKKNYACKCNDCLVYVLQYLGVHKVVKKTSKPKTIYIYIYIYIYITPGSTLVSLC